MSAGKRWGGNGASITVEKACAEFDLHPDFITNGINTGKLEFRQGITSMGLPWTKILRGQVECLINADPIGALHLARMRVKHDLIAVNKDINFHRRKLDALQVQKNRMDVWLAQNPMPTNSNQLANY